MTTETREPCLLLRVGKHLCALPLAHVDETMRPQPVRSLVGMPAFVRGVAVIRGVPVPVVDAASVLEERAWSPHPSRFVALKTGGRRVALAVDEVLGVKEIGSVSLAELPPLLAGARERAAAAMAILDNELLLVLQSARFVPDAAWNLIESGESR